MRKLYLGFLLCLFIYACSKDQREPIDTEYLKSEEYKKFNTDRQEEFFAQINDYESLQEFLRKAITCPRGPELSLPLQLDENNLQEDVGGRGNRCEFLETSTSSPYEIQSIGYSRFNDIIIRWFLLVKESVYEDSELLAVTSDDKKLTDFNIIGKFGKNLSQKISSDIQVFQRSELIYIYTTLKRKVMYPIEQENVVKNNYIINSTGNITEQ